MVRHAVAEPRRGATRSAAADAERPLTAEGRRRFVKGARGLRRLIERLDLVATSPCGAPPRPRRCSPRRSAGRPQSASTSSRPAGLPKVLLAWLRDRPRRAAVAVVGHEPGLSNLVGLLLAGKPAGFVALRKGGACLLTLPRPPRPGRATLRWLLTAGQLRRLGR